ncbi:U3 [Hyposoter didymator ichnovirus]|nr:U3 [Hyposoter didymator ichnovirus]
MHGLTFQALECGGRRGKVQIAVSTLCSQHGVCSDQVSLATRLVGWSIRALHARCGLAPSIVPLLRLRHLTSCSDKTLRAVEHGVNGVRSQRTLDSCTTSPHSMSSST